MPEFSLPTRLALLGFLIITSFVILFLALRHSPPHEFALSLSHLALTSFLLMTFLWNELTNHHPIRDFQGKDYQDPDVALNNNSITTSEKNNVLGTIPEKEAA